MIFVILENCNGKWYSIDNKKPPSDEGGGKIFDFDGGRENERI